MGRSTRSRRLPDSHCAEAAGEAWRCAFSLSLVCHRVAQQTHAGRKCMKWLHGGSKIWCGGDVWCTAFIWQPGGSGAGWLARLGGWVAVDPPAHPPTRPPAHPPGHLVKAVEDHAVSERQNRPQQRSKRVAECHLQSSSSWRLGCSTLQLACLGARIEACMTRRQVD